MVEPSKVLKLNRSNFTEIEVEIAFPQKHSRDNQHLLKASSVPIENKFYDSVEATDYHSSCKPTKNIAVFSAFR
jgi:hypothetical protein